MRVGLLEDDVAIQEMLLLVLQDEGHTVINYPSAEACLEALGVTLQDAPPLPIIIDILIVDWRLSGTATGTEVIQQVRQRHQLDALPIILTTAATFRDKEALRKMHVALLEKPFSVDDMLMLIDRLTQIQPAS